MTPQDVIARLKGVARSGSGWNAKCPAHDDRRASLSVGEGEAGKILLKCHAGCRVDAIVGALGLTPADLMPTVQPIRRHCAVYDYRDERGDLLYQVVRFEPKDFRQRRPDGKGGWIWSLNGSRRVPYRLPELLAANSEQTVFIPEGEKDVDRLRALGLVATTNAGGAGKWRPEYSQPLRGLRVVVLPDNDGPGIAHAYTVAAALDHLAASVSVIELPDLPEKGDVSDWLDAGGSLEKLKELIRNPPAPRKDFSASPIRTRTPWTAAQSATDFVDSSEPEADFLEPRLAAKGSVSEIFSPRGLGKTHVFHAICVRLARAGKRVLLIDRDNSPRETRRRLRGWGAEEAKSLKVLTRDQAPPLTDHEAWRSFPATDYDLVVLDSLDSSAEGVGEQDSAKPSRAIASILDVARREGGPGVVVLGNVVKSGQHSRGSGVIEDRADVVYEVRDATGFAPTGRKPWVQELPPAGSSGWQERSVRRGRRDSYRLAFVPTKFRIGEEPEPFIFEIDLSQERWILRDVTSQVDAEGSRARTEMEAHAITRLREAVLSAASPILKGEAERVLQGVGLTRSQARALLEREEGISWRFRRGQGPGHPLVVESFGGMAEIEVAEKPSKSPGSVAEISADRMDIDRRNSTATKAASGAASLTLPNSAAPVDGNQELSEGATIWGT